MMGVWAISAYSISSGYPDALQGVPIPAQRTEDASCKLIRPPGVVSCIPRKRSSDFVTEL